MKQKLKKRVVKIVINKLKMSVRKDLILSIFITIVLSLSYFTNLIPQKVKVENFNGKDYIFTGKYNFKNITIKQLDSLPLISYKDALNIYIRKKNIKNLEDLKKIKGIGNKKLKILKKYIKF